MLCSLYSFGKDVWFYQFTRFFCCTKTRQVGNFIVSLVPISTHRTYIQYSPITSVIHLSEHKKLFVSNKVNEIIIQKSQSFLYWLGKKVWGFRTLGSLSQSMETFTLLTERHLYCCGTYQRWFETFSNGQRVCLLNRLLMFCITFRWTLMFRAFA